MKRDDLEQKALTVCPTDIYYELMDCINETPDYSLQQIINFYTPKHDGHVQLFEQLNYENDTQQLQWESA